MLNVFTTVAGYVSFETAHSGKKKLKANNTLVLTRF